MNLSNNFGVASFNPIEGPGYEIAQLRRHLSLTSKWDSELVSPQRFGQIASDRGIGQFAKDDILGLWRIGLLRADCVEGENSPQIDRLTLFNFDSRHLNLRTIVTKQNDPEAQPPKSREVEIPLTPRYPMWVFIRRGSIF
ncbi:hypothetical protein [Acidovorax kalamii]|uniref:hypothetical protein n=1 Tax=Acidovorax kalamii TaxID=2004485 RepID=UPI0010564CE0|nr:hypothetical protein [Acidovorax kalamii]